MLAVLAGGAFEERLASLPYRSMRIGERRHLLLQLSSGTLQLDVCGECTNLPPSSIMPVIDLGRELWPQLRSVCRLVSVLQGGVERRLVDRRLQRLVQALRVADALAVGASQREIGLGIYGGDWPGDGEHLKSRVRRMIVLARRLVRAGPGGVLGPKL
ncbi:MAG: DUF2285 domain-containing protein [Novosphingobium sp.]|nr:DUF2285 domain-containing protein [Novosphingobium sp.]